MLGIPFANFPIRADPRTLKIIWALRLDEVKLSCGYALYIGVAGDLFFRLGLQEQKTAYGTLCPLTL